MNNRTYYGEYTLEHWIQLILKQNIELPIFQRSFVWKKEKAKELISSIIEGQFIPPITIGEYCSPTGERKNLIIDGQQRLTTILLAYLKCYPKKDAFLSDLIPMAGGLEEAEDANEMPSPEILDWTLRFITDVGNDFGKLKEALNHDERYEIFENTDKNGDVLNEQFFKDNYLGFSYLVPDGDAVAQQKYYAQVFRKINISGVPLLPLEARQSLYFVEPTMKNFFDPEELRDYKVQMPGKTFRLDFVRYLSTITQFKDTGNYNNVARRYYNDMEAYYSDFISDMVDQKLNNTEGRYKTSFADGKFENNVALVRQNLVALQVPKAYPSIIDMDLFFFGLLYWTIIEGKSFVVEDKDALRTAINKSIVRLKKDEAHKRTPNTISRLRERMKKSITLYKRYAR